MQKQLITDQLIEEYQKELKAKKADFFYARNGTCQRLILAKEILNIENLITRLQSKRQQEVQNVIDVYKDGDVLKHLYSDGNDYFTQTFEQKGGGNGQ
jgi:ribosomal protein S19E (S16A)